MSPEGRTNQVRDWVNPTRRPHGYGQLNWANNEIGLRAVLEMAAPKGMQELRGKSLADIGTGTGLVVRYLAPHVAKAVGVDVSEPMLHQVSPYPNLRLVAADSTRLPLPDESVDIVTTRMMLHGLPKPQAALKEAWRILRPGGRLVASEYVIDKCNENGVTQARQADTVFLDKSFFTEPSSEELDFHRQLFDLKHEPERFLWTANEFTKLVSNACPDAADVTTHYSLIPFNSVENWLSKSGQGDFVAPVGLLVCLLPWNHPKYGVQVTDLDGKPLSEGKRDELAYRCITALATNTMPDFQGVDAKIHRAFANVAVTKK